MVLYFGKRIRAKRGFIISVNPALSRLSTCRPSVSMPFLPGMAEVHTASASMALQSAYFNFNRKYIIVRAEQKIK
jgi:hypothetical protein